MVYSVIFFVGFFKLDCIQLMGIAQRMGEWKQMVREREGGRREGRGEGRE